MATEIKTDKTSQIPYPELRTVATISVNIDDKNYLLVLPKDAPLGECYNAVFSMLDKITSLLQEVKEKARPKNAEEEKEKKEEIGN